MTRGGGRAPKTNRRGLPIHPTSPQWAPRLSRSKVHRELARDSAPSEAEARAVLEDEVKQAERHLEALLEADTQAAATTQQGDVEEEKVASLSNP